MGTVFDFWAAGACCCWYHSVVYVIQDERLATMYAHKWNWWSPIYVTTNNYYTVHITLPMCTLIWNVGVAHTAKFSIPFWIFFLFFSEHQISFTGPWFCERGQHKLRVYSSQLRVQNFIFGFISMNSLFVDACDMSIVHGPIESIQLIWLEKIFRNYMYISFASFSTFQCRN